MNKLSKEMLLKVIEMLEKEILDFDNMLEKAESKIWEAQKNTLLVFQRQLQSFIEMEESRTEE